jgi:hypothetical protein
MFGVEVRLFFEVGEPIKQVTYLENGPLASNYFDCLFVDSYNVDGGAIILDNRSFLQSSDHHCCDIPIRLKRININPDGWIFFP